MGTSTVWVRGRGSENTVFTPEMAGKRTFIPSSGSIMLHSYIFCWIMLYSCSTNPHRWLSYMYRMMLDVAQIWPLEEPRTPCALKLRCQPAVPVAQPWGQLVAASPFVVYVEVCWSMLKWLDSRTNMLKYVEVCWSDENIQISNMFQLFNIFHVRPWPTC